MHKLRKAAVLVAALGGVGLLGAGTAHADGGPGGWSSGDRGHHGKHHEGRKSSPTLNVAQSTSCKSHDANVSVLGQVGILDGAAGNLLNGEGNPGAQETGLGSSMGCNNTFGGK
ncbi:hypothetical protein OG828_27245 [Streptomyces sp. NBC_00457]|uniref:hypothetical protein n=1 Tax=Streptomyces sp. NBC_00457 TaxID=2975748 RepID=UPI002E1C7E48